jgi:hypothetical protein
MHKLNGCLAVLLILVLFWSDNAECAIQRDFETWYNLQAIIKTHSQNKTLSNVRFWYETQQRLGGNSSQVSLSLIRPALGYALTENLSIWLGYAWIDTERPITPIPFKEERIWQQLLWVKTYTSLTFTNRLRTEQRYLENRPITAYRLRELMKISIPFKQHSKLSFVSSDEIFYHHNNFIGRNGQGFDQNRFFVGLGYKPNKTLNMEIGYMNQYIKRFGRPNFLANIISMGFYFSL